MTRREQSPTLLRHTTGHQQDTTRGQDTIESESKTLTIIIIRVIRLRDRLEERLRIMVILPLPTINKGSVSVGERGATPQVGGETRMDS